MRWYRFQRTHPIRLEPQPWTGRERRKRLSEITATVVAKSTSGIKLKQDGPWWNWSLPEYRGEPFNTAVKAGDRVQITYAEKEYADKETGEPVTVHFISTIDKVTSATTPQRHGGAGDEGQGPDQPFPPEEEFPLDVPESPSPPAEDYGQSLWAKDRLRARTDCLACATGIYKSVIEAGIYKEFPSAETVAGYAATLEEWAKRE